MTTSTVSQSTIRAFVSQIAAGDAAASGVFADWLAEQPHERAPALAEKVRAGADLSLLHDCLCVLGGAAEKRLAAKVERAVKGAAAQVYEPRRDRAVNPEGEFDSAGRWYPDESEKGMGSFNAIRSPSRAWPYSYMLRARTRQHCVLLCWKTLTGRNVPRDVATVADALTAEVRSLLIG